MAGPDLKRRFVRLALGLLAGGTMFQLGSCDPTVRATLLAGLEQTTATLLNTANSAFFISLQDDEDDTSTNTLSTGE
jgi:hypothetical protein